MTMEWTKLLIWVAKGAILVNAMLVSAAYMVLAERKIAAWMQNRVGPNRVGPWGLFQSFADVIKLNLKEDIVPAAAHYQFHALAPIIAIGVAITLYAVIPFGDYVIIGGHTIQLGMAPNMNIALLVILAMTSVAVYGITLAGWSSNSKYSLLGGLRSAAQMISYELSMGLSVVGVLMLSSSLNLSTIIRSQADLQWNLFYQPIGFLLFFISSLAELNRAPFDLPEAEPELVGGYHTEYTGMKFGTLYLAEYANILSASALMTALFLGGWDVPFLPKLLGLQPGSIELALLQVGSFLTKSFALVFVVIWVRWSLPRFRYDQLMTLGWKILLPIAMANIALTGIGILLFKH
ncbi:MAG: NADH-quinone oxidoreductase subunit NuoH [Bacteroidetes bacterium]|nr:NADH-quinone oxidoreductase subunit NuoH [Bacteroidota bacterium]